MQHLTKTALSRPVSTLIVILALLVFGLSAVLTTPLELTPNIEMPMLIVMTTYPGAGPEDVESLVTRKIEDAVATLGGVKNVQSMSSENVSMVILEMEYGTDMAVAHADLKNNIDIYNDALPEDASTPTVMELNINTMMPTMLLSATPLGDVDLRYYVEEEIVPEFEKLSGVAKVDVFGGAQDYISIELQEDKLSQYALTMDSVASILASADFSLPAGSIGQGELDLPLRGGVTYDSVEQVGALALMLPTGDVIHLSDVAKVYQNTEKSDSLSRYNGVENVGIQITKRQGASTVSVANAVEKAMNQLNAGAMGVQLQVAYDASTMIRVAISSVVQTLVGGVILAMAVLFLFFGDWRASLVVGASIPLSMLATVIAMKAMGFSYNILSLGGLVIGCGMMVDNSIVVLESCFRCKGGGRSFHETSIEGARVVASSVMASTITTVVVFLPIAFIQGMSGQLFGQLCFTIVFSLLASLLSAVTLVPLAFYALAPKEREYQFVKRAMAKIEGAYANVLPRTLRHKGRVVLVAIALLVISLAIVPLIGIEMLPLTDDGIVELSVTARPGLKLERLNELLLPLEQMINEHPDVDRYSLSTGGGGLGALSGSAADSATLTAYLRDNRSMSTSAVVDQWRAATASLLDLDVNVTASSTTGSMMGGSTADISLQSTNLDSLYSAAGQLEDMMRADPNILRVSSTVSMGHAQVELAVDPVKAGAAGLMPVQVMSSVRSMMVGKEIGTLHQNNRDYTLRVEYPEGRFGDLSDLSGMSISNSAGRRIPLLDVASLVYSNSPQSISRQNGRYLVTVSGQPVSSAPTNLSATLTAQAKTLTFPAGVEVTQSAQLSRQSEEFASLYGAIATAIFLVFMVMAMQFESPRFSLVVMLCIPFSLIGSFGLLLLTGTTISMPTLMGLLMLVGIVVNNGILFIDTANRLRVEEGLNPVDALVKSGTLRMRPIFMTTLTTILAMIPLAVATGGNSELMRGMAIVIIGGLTASTILTLLLLPTFYLMADRPGRQWLQKSRERRESQEV